MQDFIMLESIDELTPELIQVLIKKHNTEEVPRLKKLKNYYLGKHDILNRTMADGKPNNKIVNPYASYITDMIQGYFLGKPITYTSKDEVLLNTINELYSVNNEQAHNSLLSKDMSIYGVAYEMLYINENNEIKFAQLNPMEVFMIYDTSINPKPIGAVRYYTIKDYLTSKSITKIEVYTDTMITYYTKKGEHELTFNDEKPHYFKGVPINAYYNNDEEVGDFEKVIPLIDAYDKSISDKVNDMDYFSDAFLVITGMQDTPVEEFSDMKNNKLMLLGDNGKAEWLIKQGDTAGIEAYNTRIQKDIHKFSHVPDLSEDSMGNLSGVAIEYKFQGLEQITSNKERLFKQALAERTRLIVNILNIKGNNFNADDLKAQFTRNMPINLSEHIQTAKDLYGIVSKETLLAQLPFVDDVKAELDKLQEESNGEAPSLEYNFPTIDTEPTVEEAI